MAIMLNLRPKVYENIFFSASQPPDSSTILQIAGIADANMTAFAALNAARVLDVLSSTPARPDSRSPCKYSHLRALARNLVRNAG